MQNLRIVSVNVVDASTIEVKFTEKLTTNLAISNVLINPETPNIPTPDVLKIKVLNDTLTVTCQPLTQLAAYFIKFVSTLSNPFVSLNGTAKVFEDDVSNKYLITGPMDPENPVRTFLNNFYSASIYKTDDATLVSSHLKALTVILSKALYDIRQVGNENYLSFDVTDEAKVRGSGAFDRLNEECAYQITRVGYTSSQSNASKQLNYSTFPYYPITLQKADKIETLAYGIENTKGLFNINELILNLNYFPVTKINSIKFNFSNLTSYDYDISSLGYQILDSRYNPELSSSYLILENNQIKLNDKILDNPLFLLDKITEVIVNYEYKDQGIIISTESVNLFSIKSSYREVLPPIINVFNLKYAPIVDSDNNIPVLSGVTFLDPNNNIGLPHPAFVNEITFRLDSLPFLPGQYSIDYSTGTVYVYGADTLNDGTGPTPPVANYNYRYTFKSELDYVYDDSISEVVALPNGSLVDLDGKISFTYEKVLIPEVDYNGSLHAESLGERINNNISALNVVKTKNSPITNVFRIYNETSGEIYTVDRWNDNKIYFKYNSPPRIDEVIRERASFENNINERLFVDSVIPFSTGVVVFKILLNNNNIISGTEDSIGSSINSSINLSDKNVFLYERWFDREQSEDDNLSSMCCIGDYMVDYKNGIIYVVIADTHDFEIGTANYKKNSISPINDHLISVDDIYYQISSLQSKNKKFNYSSFGDGEIITSNLESSDETLLNNAAIYQLLNKKVGAFDDLTFIAKTTNQIKFVRGLYSFDDLKFNALPINFATVSSNTDYQITVNSLVNKSVGEIDSVAVSPYSVVQPLINLDFSLPYISSAIDYTFTVIRKSDNYDLWNGGNPISGGEPGHFVASTSNTTPAKLYLPENSPAVQGDIVIITYTFTIKDTSRIVVDYNKGDLFTDYSYLADEIIVSYEYGDNVIDFRNNRNLPANTEYFVSYKVGALRDALLRNFGTLVNVPELINFDISLDRERYRDALSAALTSFIKGPTVDAMKNIGKKISHIEPEIIESAFNDWSLGNSLLNPKSISTTGEFQLLPAKYGNGVLIENEEQTIKFPISSNLRLEEGTFETWVLPQWNGLDNNSDVTFYILKNGANITDGSVFIGGGEYHPVVNSGKFTLNKNDNVSGIPNRNKDGIFIYHDVDSLGINKWHFQIVDGYVGTSSSYKVKVSTNGNFYDVKNLEPVSMLNKVFTGTDFFNLNIVGGSPINLTWTFISDVEHYLLDFGEELSKNRLSIFKDAGGYLNLRVFDKFKTSYIVSANVANWKNNEQHHIAASWKLNNINNRDEIHFFVDGFEVPNIIKYGQKLQPNNNQLLRSVNVEEIIGSSDNAVVSGNNCNTVSGSDVVVFTYNVSGIGIQVGDTIYIEEDGFDDAGYVVTNISGNNVTLDDLMPASITNANYVFNKISFVINSDIDIASNTTVSTIYPDIIGNDLVGTSGLNYVTSITNFETLNVIPGQLLEIKLLSPLLYTILEVSGNTLTINGNLPSSFSSTDFSVYGIEEVELSGLRSTNPEYRISKDSNFDNVLTITGSYPYYISPEAVFLVRTFGINHRKVKRQHYVWSDDLENILMTRLPSPVSLDEVKITKILLPKTLINSGNSSPTLGIYYSNNFTSPNPSNSQNGRTISVTISGNNVDFTSPVNVTINGVSGIYTISETVSFSDYGTLDFINSFISINYINVNVKPLNVNKSFVNVEVREKYSITHSEFSGLVPVVRFSYVIGAGSTLYSDGYDIFTDDSAFFSDLYIGNYLVISSPILAAGYYKIIGVSDDRKSIQVQSTSTSPSLPVSFTGGVYQILNTNQYRSGLQNGYFTFEAINMPGIPWLLSHGFYELEYETYTNIKLDPLKGDAYIGSDFKGKRQFNGIIDQVKIYSNMLNDTRIRESIPSNQTSITKDFNSLKALKKDTNTLMLIDFDSFPFTNKADFYLNSTTVKDHFQSSFVVNDNFKNSVYFADKPLVLSNDGILDTRKEATIEFWINPTFDTGNDPNTRFYFDAFGAIIEDAISTDYNSIKISNQIEKVLSVKLKSDSNTDYFAGGKLEIDTQKAIVEQAINNLSVGYVTITNPIFQVISVRIVGDLSETDYFAGGSISSDKLTIYLGKELPSLNLSILITYKPLENNNEILNTQVIRLNRKLPYKNSKVEITYLPKGTKGDRISLFKDNLGYFNFAISASGIDYFIKAPIYWAKNTWHRIKASYKVNSGNGSDEMRLFIDGYEFTQVLVGQDLVFGDSILFGQSKIGDQYHIVGDISLKDSINTLFIGSQFDKTSPIFSLIDNLRISNLSRPIYAPFGEPIDIYYSNNLSTVFPVTKDLFTTYLLDFNQLAVKNTDFANLKNRETGSFDFSMNIIDSFGIVEGSSKVQEILEALIKTLKPANSKAYIRYIK